MLSLLFVLVLLVGSIYFISAMIVDNIFKHTSITRLFGFIICLFGIAFILLYKMAIKILIIHQKVDHINIDLKQNRKITEFTINKEYKRVDKEK